MKYLIIVLLSVLIISCSPERQIAKLVQKHPDLIQTRTDTVKIDTFIVTAPIKHGFDLPMQFTDTMYLHSDKVDLQFYKDKEKDTIRVNVKVAPDTVYINVFKPIKYKNIKVNQVKKTSDLKYYIKLIGGLLIGMLILILIIKLVK